MSDTRRDCNAILKGGIFNVVAMKTGSSLSENILSWLNTSSYEEMNTVIDNGGFVGIPIEGGELGIKPKLTLDDYQALKKAIEEGRIRQFTQSESMQLISLNASPVIANAWLICMREPADIGIETTGLVATLTRVGRGEHLILKVRYYPTSLEDFPPTIARGGFQIAGATTEYPLVEGAELPLAGTAVLLKRSGIEEVVVQIVTTKGMSKSLVDPILEVTNNDIKLRVEKKGTTYFAEVDLIDDRFAKQLSEVRYEFGAKYRLHVHSAPDLGISPIDSDGALTQPVSSSVSTNHFQATFDFGPVYKQMEETARLLTSHPICKATFEIKQIAIIARVFLHTGPCQEYRWIDGV